MNNRKFRKKRKEIYDALNFDLGRIFLPEDRAFVLDLISDFTNYVYFTWSLDDTNRHLLANMMLTVMDYLERNKGLNDADKKVDREDWLLVRSVIKDLAKKTLEKH